MAKKIGKTGLHVLIAALVIAAIASALSFSRAFSKLENGLWDLRVSLTAKAEEADDSIKIISISQQSLDHFAKDSITWPWPRPLYIPVVEFLKNAGAKGLAVDILFTETSVHGAADDAEFAKALKGDFPVVTALSLSSAQKDPSHQNYYQQFKRRQSENLDLKFSNNLSGSYSSAALPIFDLLRHSPAFGSVNANPDSDGMFRHYPMGFKLDDTPVLSLPFSFYYSVKGELPKNLSALADSNSTFIANFHGPAKTYQTIDFADVVSSYVQLQEGKKPLIDPSVFKNSWVFLGVWAPGLLDLRPISLDERYRGVEYLATVLDNIIHQDFIKRSPPAVDALLTFLISLLAGLVFTSSKSVSRQIVWFVILTTAYSLFAILMAEFRSWVDFSSPVLAMILIFASSLSIHYYHEGRQHRFIKSAFGHYVSKDIIKKIIADPNQLALGGEKKNLSIFFSDLAGFTTISESLEPKILGSMLNEYLSEMTDIIIASGGTLDKYEGDAIIAFWNAPMEVRQHENVAVRAALDCQQRLAELREKFKNEYGVDLKMRIGVHTGDVIVGNFGSKARFNYTVIGDAANLAARLEGVNKLFGTEILISGFTREELSEEINCRKVADIRVVGRQEPVPIYEPLDLSHSYDTESIVKFENCRLDFEKGSFDKARLGFKELNGDPVARAYLERIDSINGDQTDDWQPVWNLTEK